MQKLDDEQDATLARLRAQTEGLCPSPGFEEKLLVLLGATTANDAYSFVWRWGKVGVVVASLAAAAGVLLALSQTAELEQEEALAYGTQEYFE